MLNSINNFAREFLKETEKKPVRIISHNDTDGITSAAILSKALKRLEKRFSLRIVKNLEKEIVEKELERNEREVILFADLASGSLGCFKELKEKIFILDHHEINKNHLNEKIKIINPHLFNEENICSAGIAYLFAKALLPENEDLSSLAVIGMIGDRLDSNITRINQQIISETKELVLKKGLLIFSATRPLRRSLEYSTSCYIPGVTGSSSGVLELLRETSINPKKTLYELDENEMSRLVTAVMLRRAKYNGKEPIIGNIYLLKFFNHKEDARELSVLINACSRLGYPDVAISFCLGNKDAKSKAEDIYLRYKQELISGLKTAEKIEKISGQGFVILNAREEIKDTIIGTITSILSSSLKYEMGTILIGMAYNHDKIKVSARIVGEGRNLKEVLERTVVNLEADVGGHSNAAGCLIKKEDESLFLESLKKNLEIEIMKI